MSEIRRTEWRGGEHHGRHPQLRIVAVFAVIFIVLAAIAVGIALLSAPPGVKPICTRPGCAAPPHPVSPGGIGTSGALGPAPGRTIGGSASAAPALTSGSPTFTSPGFGYSFEYPSGLQVASFSASRVVLVNGSTPDLIVYVIGEPVSAATPQDIQRSLLSSLGQQIPNLAEVDPSSAEAIPAAELGGHAGVGGFYQGYIDSPTAPQTNVDLAVLAASDGRQSLGVAVESLNRDATQGRLGALDQLMFDTFHFAGDIVR